MPDDSKSGSPAHPAEIWTWWLSFLALLVFLDLCALTWYFQQLPEASFKNWGTILSTGATWLSAVVAYLGIKYTFGNVNSLAEVLRIRPVQLCILGLTGLTWYFVVPFHTVTVSIADGSGKPLPGIKVKVETETAARPTLSDAQGKIVIRGLLATSHNLRFQGDGYREEPATAGFMDVLTFGQIAVALKPNKFRVEFRTIPDRAEVYLDGDEKNRKGHTPLELVLATERSKVMFKKSRYQPTTWEEIVWEQIPESKGTREVRRDLVLLKPVRMFPLAVSSDPVGAGIIVDGKLVGTTPDTIMLAEGRRRVELKKDGYSASCNVRMPDPDTASPICFRQLGGPGAQSKP